MRVDQISILLRNEPGVLSDILENLNKADVNIIGLTINETTNFGELRIVVDKPANAKEVLKDMAVSYNVVKIFVLKLENKPGALLSVVNVLSKNDINIDYIYTLVSLDNHALVAVKTWNMPETEKLLSEIGVSFVNLDNIL